MRFMRHVDLPEIGEEGCRKLLDSRILIVGMGGLGSIASLYLAGAGIGKLGLVDDDIVEESNLQRQIIYSSSDIRESKVLASRKKLEALSGHTEIECFDCRLNEENGNEIIRNYDLVIDGSDNFKTRFLLNKFCYQNEKPLVSASVHHFDGQVSTFKAYLGGNHPCYQCLYEQEPEDGSVPSCTEAGVLGPTVGIMGLMQATEAIKEILGIGESLSGKIYLYNALHTVFQTVDIAKRPECPVCS